MTLFFGRKTHEYRIRNGGDEMPAESETVKGYEMRTQYFAGLSTG
jgi:hypothetical protein